MPASDLPANDLRKTVLTLAVPTDRLPSVAAGMRALLPAEDYDPGFAGQYLQTTYFDSSCRCLRKARLGKDKYLIIRIRCYSPTQQPGGDYPQGRYALSLKTESGKYRTEISTALAESLLANGIQGPGDMNYLPPDFLARYLDLVGEDELRPVVTVCFTRYAVESSTDRMTLDTEIEASNGKKLPASILEVKSITKPYEPLPEVLGWRLPPVKLSKFLWATTYGER
jgi:hypothetical protein